MATDYEAQISEWREKLVACQQKMEAERIIILEEVAKELPEWFDTYGRIEYVHKSARPPQIADENLRRLKAGIRNLGEQAASIVQKHLGEDKYWRHRLVFEEVSSPLFEQDKWEERLSLKEPIVEIMSYLQRLMYEVGLVEKDKEPQPVLHSNHKLDDAVTRYNELLPDYYHCRVELASSLAAKNMQEAEEKWSQY